MNCASEPQAASVNDIIRLYPVFLGPFPFIETSMKCAQGVLESRGHRTISYFAQFARSQFRGVDISQLLPFGTGCVATHKNVPQMGADGAELMPS